MSSQLHQEAGSTSQQAVSAIPKQQMPQTGLSHATPAPVEPGMAPVSSLLRHQPRVNLDEVGPHATNAEVVGLLLAVLIVVVPLVLLYVVFEIVHHPICKGQPPA